MIYLTGDIHGSLGVTRFTNHNFPAGRELTRQDYVIILGDFGFVWQDPPSKTESKWLDWLNQKPWTTLFVDGNHENFTLLNTLPRTEQFGGVVGVARPNILHLRRGHCYTIDGKRFLAFGGARSIDQRYRIPGESWWPEELPSEADTSRLWNSVDAGPIDYVLTHTAPTDVYRYMYPTTYMTYPVDPTCVVLQRVMQCTQFHTWFFGHFHENRAMRVNDRNFVCLYEQIVQLTITEDLKSVPKL